MYLVLFIVACQGIHDNIYPQTKCHGPLRLTTRDCLVFPASQRIFCPGAAQVVLRINYDGAVFQGYTFQIRFLHNPTVCVI